MILQKSPLSKKKFRINLDDGRHVDFGAVGYSDFTKHKDPARMRLYVIRHQSREKWGKNGIDTAGFWSRWILWSKPDLKEAIRYTEKKFGLRIYLR